MKTGLEKSRERYAGKAMGKGEERRQIGRKTHFYHRFAANQMRSTPDDESVMRSGFPLSEMLLLERCELSFEQLDVGEVSCAVGVDEEDAVTGRVEDALYGHHRLRSAPPSR